MRALRVERHGGPEQARLVNIPTPTPGPGELLVEVVYVGVNYMDVYTREGRYRSSRAYSAAAPLTIGMEAAGTVVSAPPGSGFEPGDPVAWCLVWGSAATYAVVPASRAVRVPAGVPLQVAAAAIFPGITASYLVDDVAQVGPGSTVVVTAAAGSVGQLLSQLAGLRGARVIAASSTPDKQSAVAQLGVAASVGYDELASRVADLTAGVGADVVLDSVGAPMWETVLACAAVRGLVVSVGSVGGPLEPIASMQLAEAGSLVFTRPRLADFVATDEAMRKRASAVLRSLADGSLRREPSAVLAFEQFAEAYAALEERRALGKSVLRVSAER